jgi:hypothetical protein
MPVWVVYPYIDLCVLTPRSKITSNSQPNLVQLPFLPLYQFMMRRFNPIYKIHRSFSQEKLQSLKPSYRYFSFIIYTVTPYPNGQVHNYHQASSRIEVRRLIKTLYKPLQPSTLLTTNLKSAAIPLKLNKPKLQLNPSKQVTH